MITASLSACAAAFVRKALPGTSADDDAVLGYQRRWDSLIEQFTTHPDLWVASVDLFLQARRQPELRARLAGGIGEGRRGMAGILRSVPEDEVTDHDARTLGMIQSALMPGVMVQALSDPENAPTSAEVLEGLRALAAVVGR